MKQLKINHLFLLFIFLLKKMLTHSSPESTEIINVQGNLPVPFLNLDLTLCLTFVGSQLYVCIVYITEKIKTDID